MSKDKIKCPKCKVGHLIKYGVRYKQNKPPIQRWKCSTCKKEVTLNKTKPNTKTVLPDSVSEFIKENHGKPGFYIVTSAQNCTPVHENFWKSVLYLEQDLKDNYKDYHVTKLVIPFRYRNPTSQWTSTLEKEEWWSNLIANHICSNDVKFNDNAMIMGEAKIVPTNKRPLSGRDNTSDDLSALYGSPKREMRTVATPQNKMAKILYTTGTCTVSNYSDTNVGHKAKKYHQLGMILVKVINKKKFFFYEINATPDGSFIHLDKYYCPTGVFKTKDVFKGHSLIECGDSHLFHEDKKTTQVLFFGFCSLASLVGAKEVFFNDLLDFHTQNHHHIGNWLYNAYKQVNGTDFVFDEVKYAVEWLNKLPSWIRPIIKRSNHDEAFDKWLSRVDPRDDNLNPYNRNLYFQMQAKMYPLVLEQAENNKAAGLKNLDNFSPPMAFKFLCQELGVRSDALFLQRDQSCVRYGREHGFHGHIGIAGARGSTEAFTKMGIPVSKGHSHSSEILDWVRSVSTTCKPKMGYNTGPSKTIQSVDVTYPNGMCSMFHLIENEFE